MGSFDGALGADDEEVVGAGGRDFYSGTITRGVNSEVSILKSDNSLFSSCNITGENIVSTMRWKNGENNNGPGEFLSEKTFLVLKDEDIGVFELAKAERAGFYKVDRKNKPNEEEEESKIRFTPRSKPKSAAVSGNANTWPPKLKKSPSTSCASLERPKTANLEEPTLLDPRLVDKLDMSMLSKELLCDSMTHMRLINCGGTASGQGIERRRQSLNIPSRGSRREFQEPGRSGVATPVNSGIISLARQKRRSFEPLTDSELAYDLRRRETSPEVGTNTFLAAATTMKKQGNRAGPIGTNDQPVVKRFNSESRGRDDNNNKSRTGSLTPKISALSLTRKKSSKISIKSDVELFTGTTTNAAPEPCKTCGRSDQPERFHSHPKNSKIQQPQTQIKSRDNSAPKKSRIAVPKSIQKPVALNFRSEKRTPPPPQKNLQRDTTKQDNIELEKKISPVAIPPSPKRGPRSVTCYICSREFGTASFPIHEPKCLEKWERENNALPPSQRRAVPPQRPEAQPGHQGWNKAAWEQSQAQLLPCSRCGRTFLPDRLPVHEKSCKVVQKKQPTQKSNDHQEPAEIIRVRDYPSGGSVNQSQSAAPVATPRESPMVFCRICGRSFGSRSIKIHEPQCLKRSHKTDNDGTKPPNNRNDAEQPQNSNASSFTEVSFYHRKTVPCYICGRDFGSTSIGIHEPQCLRKWEIENEKLPQDQRRKQPEKPEVVLKRDVTGADVIDQAATAEANWRSHLGQLVPCKRCGRTFNPDRVSVHERGCKGTR